MFGVASPLSSMYFSSVLKLCLPRFDLGADAAVPRAVALLEHPVEHAVLADRGGDLQAAGKGVHAADVGVEQIDRLEALAADLGVEVQAAGREAAVLQAAPA